MPHQILTGSCHSASVWESVAGRDIRWHLFVSRGCRSPTWQRGRGAGGGVQVGRKPLAGAQLGVRGDLQGEAALRHPGAAPRESLHLHRGMSAD